MMKTPFKIIICIVSFFIASASFGQNLSDVEKVYYEGYAKRLKEKGFSDEEIKNKISAFPTITKISPTISQTSSNRSVQAIPPNERVALVSLYNSLGGVNWTTPMNQWAINDLNSDVSTWAGVGVSNGHVVTLRIDHASGTIPNLTALSFLESLDITATSLSGNLLGLQSLPSLKILDIKSSGGTIDALLPISTLSNLEQLNMSLTGTATLLDYTLPTQFSNLSHLRLLMFNTRNGVFNGDLSTLGSLLNLEVIILQTSFAGPLPSNFSNLHHLQNISIFFGGITDISVLGNLPTLKVISLVGNAITTIPANFNNLIDLKVLNLSSNQITGTVPSFFSSYSLQLLDLSRNKIEGTLPAITHSTQSYSYQFNNSNYSYTQGQFDISYNKFRFNDFSNEFSYYLYNWGSRFMYLNQGKTDLLPNQASVIVGGLVTLKMSDDVLNNHIRYTPYDTFQWYKDGSLISGATGRLYTINNASNSDAGVYTCKSYHVTNPDMSPLVLERNPITLTVTAGASTLEACPEGFESTSGPEALPSTNWNLGTGNWAVFDNGVGTGQRWEVKSTVNTPPYVYQGTNAAYINRENIGQGNTSEDYLSTPLVTIPTNGELRFFTRTFTSGNQGTIYQIKIAPASANRTDPFSYSLVAQWTENQLTSTFNIYEEKKVDLSAYQGLQVYVSFVKVFTQPTAAIGGDRWLVDDVRLVSKCQEPIDPLSYTPDTQTSGTIAWGNNVADPSQFQVEYGPVGFALGTGTTAIVNTNSYPINGLTQNAQYQFYVKRLCTACELDNNSNYAGPFPFTSALNLYCESPNSLTVSNYTGTSATLSWTQNGASSWEVWAIPENNIPPTPQTAGIIVNTPTYALTNLLSNVSYNFFVRAICDTSNISQTVSIPINGQSNELCTRKNPTNTTMIKQLFVYMMNDLIGIVNSGGTVPSAYNSSQLQALAPYIYDSNPRIYNFSYTNNIIKFSFADHGLSVLQDVEIPYAQSYGTMSDFDVSTFFSPQFHLLNAIAIFQNSNSKAIISHIDFCKVVTPGDSCTKTNPLSSVVKAKFIDLVNYLHQQLSLGVNIPSGYNCPQLDALRPYLSDPNAKIYNINAEPFSFSFHPNGPREKFDVYVYQWPLSGSLNITDINLTPYVDAVNYTTLDNLVTMSDMSSPKNVFVRHVNFCPPRPIQPDCEVHFDFNFKVPSQNKGGLFTIQQKENIANGIVNFINTKLGQDLYISTFDDYYGGNIRKTVLQTKFLTTVPQAIPNNPETYVTGLLRIQDDNYTNTFQHFITAANGVVSNPLITKQIDIAFFILSNDKYTNINDAKAAYDALLASTIVEGGVTKPRVKKVFFVVFDQGSFKKTGTPPLNSVAFLTALKGGVAPIDYNTVGNVFNSDYIQFTTDQVISSSFPSRFNEFLQNAYEVAKKDCSSESCTNSNPRSYTVKVKFLELVNKLHEIANNGGTIPNGFTCAELIALKPYLTDKNPKIFNFHNAPFSFSFHEVSKENEYDVLINKWDYTGDSTVATINDLNILSFTDPSVFTILDGKATLSNGLKPERTEIRHVNFCPGEGEISCTVDNENSEVVSELFIDLVQYLMHQKLNGVSDDDINSTINGASPIALNNLRPFLTDFNSGLYNFVSIYNGEVLTGMHFSFSKDHETDVYMDGDFLEVADLDLTLDLSSYTSSNDYTDLAGDYSDQAENDAKIFFSKFIIRHIDLCPPSVLSCTATNPRSARVKSLFINLVNRIKTEFETNGTISDGWGDGVPELTLLSPYITDLDPHIYNFTKDPFAFSFHSGDKDGKYDVLISKGPIAISSNVATITNLAPYSDPLQYTDLGGLMTFANGYQPEDVQVRHINFCPDKYCVNHIAIVVDESGSLTDLEKTKIRRQLKNFVKQQAQFNHDTGGEMHVSLIGMSDSDSDGTRTDHVIQELVTDASVNESTPGIFIKWINEYGNRYHNEDPMHRIPGVSEGSDYWNSGLKRALDCTMPPDLVIMITDGSQSADIHGLATTMSRFENSTFIDTSTGLHQVKDASKPHLYVIGIDNGFYVYGDTSNILPREQDPNYTHNLPQTNALSRTMTSSLALSLKYLLELEDATFPTPDPKHFMAPPNFTTPNPDYYGYDSFAELGEDPTYLSDRIKRADIGCGKEAVKDPCDDCFSFQPEPGKVYVLNAWAKEEMTAQVENYDSPKIKLIFKNINEQTIGFKEFTTKGDIIEGWQRIGDKFEIPYDEVNPTDQTVYVEFELINQSKIGPVFFDDIRIYPVKGSMKTFVYDSENFRLMSELDENNYSTYYEYDNEGGLVRVKKETAEGIKTIQETRSGNYIKRD